MTNMIRLGEYSVLPMMKAANPGSIYNVGKLQLMERWLSG